MARISLKCAVLSISSDPDRADSTGDYLQEALIGAGHQCVARARSLGDLYDIRRQLSDWIDDPDVQDILCNGGTGYGEHKNTEPAVRDRKSTRLNSSHVAISYAVFCSTKNM